MSMDRPTYTAPQLALVSLTLSCACSVGVGGTHSGERGSEACPAGDIGSTLIYAPVSMRARAPARHPSACRAHPFFLGKARGMLVSARWWEEREVKNEAKSSADVDAVTKTSSY